MRMLKIRNAILLIGSALLLGGTLLCTVADRAGISFPDWMAVNAKHSNLEGRNYTKLPNASIDAVMSGKFQNTFELCCGFDSDERRGSSSECAHAALKYCAYVGFGWL